MTDDTLLFYSQVDDAEAWRAALQAAMPDLPVRVFPDVGDPDFVRYALVWNPPQGFFNPFHQLQLVVNLGAGVDALLARTDLPDVSVVRLSDPDMARMMAGYVLFAVLRYARDIPQLEAAQRRGKWHYIHPREAGSIRVGVLGLGELGGLAATELTRQGFDVHGWSRTLHTLPGVTSSAGLDALPDFLRELEILVVMLPLTPQTRGLLDAARLAMLPHGAKLINVARGSVVDEAALIAALQSGAIGAATLDVFQTEPLAEDHPFWTMPTVLITPHLASVAIPGSAAVQIAENIRRIRDGQEPQHRVDPARGY